MNTNDLVAINMEPSEELKEYHKNSCIQININNLSLIRKIMPEPVSTAYYENVVKPQIDFVSSCCGINEELLGKADD